MSTALATRDEQAIGPVVTSDQMDLIRRTIAKDATPDELKLYLYDCARQGVHPLDKLLHFTKRSGKYTPITSIDFMRIRAADTGEYAGSNDAEFIGKPGDADFAATVTVTRLVQGNFATFTATARWAEYKPESNDFMWKKMPHTMLAKCAEALALRKGFPRQLAGLYAKEEMDQADKGGYQVQAPVGVDSTTAAPPRPAPVEDAKESTLGAPAPSVPESGHLTIQSVDRRPTKNANVTKFVIVLSDGREVTTIKSQLGDLAEQVCQDGDAVTVETKSTRWGEDLTALSRVSTVPEVPAGECEGCGMPVYRCTCDTPEPF